MFECFNLNSFLDISVYIIKKIVYVTIHVLVCIINTTNKNERDELM